MRGRFIHKAVLSALLLCQFSVCLGIQASVPNQSSKYLDAVREFADNVLKYGRDTYGPKHTPLFVDGLNIHTHEPVKWIAPNGNRWILSNLASQQNLFRTLDGLTKITGDPKYRRAAMDAIKYAFENLRSPNGLLYWGGHSAYDAGADKPCGRGIHELKGCYPYYELMWEVNPQATKQFIDAFWSGHILDWSNLDMDRHCYNMTQPLNNPWEHEYKGEPVFFGGNGVSFLCTGGDLFYAAALLTKLSGEKEPLVWSKRLAQRYVETRDPSTGIGAHGYTSKQKKMPTIDGLKNFDLHAMDYSSFFPFCPTYGNSELRRCCYAYCVVSPGIPYNIDEGAWASALLVGEMMGSDGKNLIQWSIEELTARGKVAYRKSDNSWIPMLLNGTHLEGQIIKKGGSFGPEGTEVKSVPTIPMDFWTYSLVYRLTGNEFMWQMARNIAFGNGFGDIGTTSNDLAELKHSLDCADPYALMGFLELYKKTGCKAFLDSAEQIGSNILATRFYKGFFVPSSKYVYTRFDSPESFALLHLHVANISSHFEIPTIWPSLSFFEDAYRKKDAIDDIGLIYTLMDSSNPPISLQEAAAVGNVELVRMLIEKGAKVDGREDSFFKTALHRATLSGRKAVVEFLLAKGAQVDARDSYICAPLHYAAEKGHKEVAELLIAGGADVDAKSAAGDTPLQYAAYADNKDIIDLLLQKGATIANLHIAAYMGDLAKIEAFIQEGVDINVLDGHGYAPLHYAAQNNQKEVIELLISKGADANVKNWGGETPLHIAVSRGHKDIIELLLSKGANINAADNTGKTLLDIALSRNRKDIVELLLAKGAEVSSIHIATQLGDLIRVKAFLEKGTDINVGDNRGFTPLRSAVEGGHKEVVEFLIAKGADVKYKSKSGWTLLHSVAEEGHKAVAEILIAKGADINAKDEDGYTPLYSAIWNEDKDMVKLLVDKGADVNVLPDDDGTPLEYAVWNEDMDMAKLFIARGAKLDAKDNDGWTAFRYAVSQGNREIVEFFVSKGADVSTFHMAACVGDLARVKDFVEKGTDVDTKDEVGWTPLFWAVSMSQEEVTEFLIAKGAKVNAKANDERTVLHQAARAGAIKLVELLIAKGADVNAKSENGQTPLHSAVRRGQRDIVEILLVKGADVNVKDSQGRTPLNLAEKRGHTEIAELLRKRPPAGACLFDGVFISLSEARGEGFHVRDVAANSEFVRFEHGAMGLELKHRQEQTDSATFFDVTISDTTGKDRAITLVYTVPLSPEGCHWLQDPRRSLAVKPGQEYINARKSSVGANGYLSHYPFAAVATAEQGIGLGIDMSQPAFFRVGYNAGTKELFLAYDIGLAPEKPTAHVRFCKFTFDPKWGFRAALARYYKIFPDYFRCRTAEQGLWMPFAKISDVNDWQDFGFKFKEGNNETGWDDEHNIITFRYTEPMTWWMRMPKEMPRTLQAALDQARYLADEKLDPRAKALFTSGYHDEAGQFSVRLLNRPWCDGAVWSINSMPGVQGETTDFKNKWNEKLREELYGAKRRGDLDGEYIDSSEGYVTDELDFRCEHFTSAQTPLTFSLHGRRVAIFRGLVAFEYVRAIAQDIHAMDKLMMANSTPSRLCWLTPLLDVMGTETNWNPNGTWRPMSDSDLLYRRSLCKGKPYCFLMNTNFEEFSHELVEKYMKRCLAYGMFPGFFSHNASQGHYFTRPELYERDRSLFKKYVPLCKLVAEAGWEPITLAHSSDGSVYVERFGDRFFTVFNDSAERRMVTIRLERNTPKAARELVHGQSIKWRDQQADLTLDGEDVAVIEIN